MIEQELAKFARQTTYDKLPADVIKQAKLCLLDLVGAACAGATALPGHVVTEIIEEAGGSPQAVLIGRKEKVPALNAALGNGLYAHALELDDLHRSSILRPGSPIIPAALAAAEKTGASGKDLITAIVVGYEVGIRIAEAMTPSHYNFWHTTGTCGTFAAAIAAGKVMNLDEEQLIHALGHAGTQAAGLMELHYSSEGMMSKPLHASKAAQNGLFSAMLAKGGYTSTKTILSGEKGFLRVFAPKAKMEKIVETLGVDFKIMQISYRIYASTRHTHAGIDLALRLRGKGIKPEDIELLRIQTYSVARDLVGEPFPESIYEAKFSLPFCVSTALVYGHVGVEDFTEQRIKDPVLEELMSHCTVEIDPLIDAHYPQKWGAKLNVILRNGTIDHEQTDFPKGDPENKLTLDQLHTKFRRLSALLLPPSKIEAWIEQIMKVESFDNIADMWRI
ncbi:MAG: MmgE/PrpD family protein [Firmicutes bacterium]|nr:MmgE/PrpD family protein [Bacillota bacterium]